MSQLQDNLREILRQKTTYLLPANIKKDVTILDVTGTYEGQIPALQSKSITITENGLTTVSADSGYDGLSSVAISAQVGEGGPITQEEYNIDEELARSILEDFTPYTELEYIESTGTQYINTGYKANQDTKIDIIIEPIEWGDYRCPFGVRTSTYVSDAWVHTNRFATWIYNSKDNILQIGNDGRIVYSTTRNYIATKFNLIVDNGSIYIKDLTNNYEAETFTFTPMSNFTTDYNLLLGALTNNGTDILNLCKFKLYSCKIYEGNALLKDFVPAKNRITDRVGLYDKVGNTFLYNPGEGEFVAGGVANANVTT